MLPARLVVFTDLDGTLLDHHSYSAEAAAEALELLQRRGVPVVFVTSKTRMEVEFLRRELENKHPFITENGGGVFIPQEYFKKKIPGEIRMGRYHVLALGKPYPEVCEALEELASEARAEVVGFHQMSAKEIAQNTGLDKAQAELARIRDFDEPFFFAGEDPAAEGRLSSLARERGYEITRGGRFCHLFSGSDKGRAVKQLFQLYREGKHSRLRSVGLGDSENDLPMLAAVDLPVLLPKPGGEHDEEVLARLPRAKKGLAPGPEGWNQAILEILQSNSER